MALPKKVQDAIDSADNDCGLDLTYITRDEWHAIREHLMIQESEIDRLQHDLNDADERSALRSRERTEAVMRADKAESRLAAANALLRRFMRCTFTRTELTQNSMEAMLGNDGVREDAHEHLQGAGDEA